jgi:hypothetical protein
MRVRIVSKLRKFKNPSFYLLLNLSC